MTPLVSPALLERLNSLGDHLKANILGQETVLDDIVLLLQRSFCGLRFPARPMASMLFLGPTGTGKTETCNLFTQHLFDSPDKLVRLDMSEFQNQSALGVLVGDRVGERGLFGQYYDRSRRSGTLLFDEIEKAHPLVMDIFLQVLSAARFTLASGETLDLSNYIVCATTNIGSRLLMESRSTDRDTIERRAIQAGTQEMRPETFARFQRHYVFSKLDYLTLRRVGQLHTENVVRLFNAQGHSIAVDTSVVECIQREGYSERFGARPMAEAALRIIGDVVSQEMLRNDGMPVQGTIHHDRRSNVCTLKQ